MASSKSTVKISKGHKRLMTPKEERAPLGKHKIWDDLSDMKDNIVGGVHAIGIRILGAVKDIRSNPGKEQFLPSKEYFYSLIQRASDDINNHKKIIDEISSQHANKTGDATSADDYALALQLHGRYAEITEITTDSLILIGQEIQEYMRIANEKFSQQPIVTENSDGTNTIEFETSTDQISKEN